MELLLNLLWLMLVVPALFIWRHERESPCQRSTRSLLALACVLVLLFPVISVTDDLHPLQAEMEENSLSKRTVKQSPGARSAVWSGIWETLAQSVVVLPSRPDTEVSGLVSEPPSTLPEQGAFSVMDCRPPPLA